MTGASTADVGHAGAVVHLGGDPGEDGLEPLIRLLVASGHDRRTESRARFTAADAGSQVAHVGTLDHVDAALGVGVEGVAAIHDGVVGIEQRNDLLENRVDGAAGVDHQNHPPRAFQGGDEILQALGPPDVRVAGVAFQELRGAAVGSVVNRQRKTPRGDVEGEVSTHDAQADQSGGGGGRHCAAVLSDSSAAVVCHSHADVPFCGLGCPKWRPRR